MQQYSNLKNHVTKKLCDVISGIPGIYVLPRVSLLGFFVVINSSNQKSPLMVSKTNKQKNYITVYQAML